MTAELSRYPEIRHRARPNVFMDLFGEILADEIEHGYMNFFDVPFGSKVVVRGSHSTWIQAGAHGLKHPRGAREVSLPPSRIRAGHVPLLSRSRMPARPVKARPTLTLACTRRMDGRARCFVAWRRQGDSRISGLPTPSRLLTTGVRPVTPSVEPDDALPDALKRSVEILTNRATHHGAVHDAEFGGQSTCPSRASCADRPFRAECL